MNWRKLLKWLQMFPCLQACTCTLKYTLSLLLWTVSCSVAAVSYEVSNGLPLNGILKTFHRIQTDFYICSTFKGIVQLKLIIYSSWCRSKHLYCEKEEIWKNVKAKMHPNDFHLKQQKKKVKRVWNDLRISKWWQNFYFWLNCPFNILDFKSCL